MRAIRPPPAGRYRFRAVTLVTNGRRCAVCHTTEGSGAHHVVPAVQGGASVETGVPLCRIHHSRADEAYRTLAS